jgi:Fe-S cluster assembly iron-binding protein IscA
MAKNKKVISIANAAVRNPAKIIELTEEEKNELRISLGNEHIKRMELDLTLEKRNTTLLRFHLNHSTTEAGWDLKLDGEGNFWLEEKPKPPAPPKS